MAKEKKFDFIEKGSGRTIIILHGLMGGLSNFDYFMNTIYKENYRLIFLKLPVYTITYSKANITNLVKYLHKFIKQYEIKDCVLLGNSMGGHVGLSYANQYPENVGGLILSGSSGLYENSFNDSYPRRGSYDYIEKKTQEVFYDKKTATKELVDEIYEIVQDRTKLIRIISFAKSAINHNMEKDLPNIKVPTAIIWGRNDIVTPPDVAETFDTHLPNSSLYWLDKCGHAPMMEHPEKFNEITLEWLKENNL